MTRHATTPDDEHGTERCDGCRELGQAARIAKLEAALTEVVRMIERGRHLTAADAAREALGLAPDEDEAGVEYALAIDGRPVCVCSGDDPEWRESVGHESYCPRSNR